MSEKVITSTEQHEGDVTCLCYRNKLVYSGGADGKIRVWDSDLNIINVINAHDSYICDITFDSKGKLYSCSCDGVINEFQNPENSSIGKEILRCENYIQTLVTYEDALFSGDDKGIVTMWVDGQIKYKYNLVEEVRSLAVEKDTLYSVCDKDVVITTMVEGTAISGSGRFMIKAVMPGRNPIALIGPVENGIHKWVAFSVRDGKGFLMISNNSQQKFATVWTKENAHEMMINAISGNHNTIFTAGWDGKIKKWTEIETDPKLVDEADVGTCINALAMPENAEFVFVGGTDGFIRKIKF